jgi:hypothetical protein
MAEVGDRELTGIGGWLLFFVIALSVLSPIASVVGVGSLYSDPSIGLGFGDDWPAIQAGEWTLVAASVAAAWFLTWRLVNVRNRATVRMVIGGIWLIAVGGSLLEMLLVLLIADIDLPTLLPELGATVVRPFVFCTIWTLYFLRSRRVANTYHPTSDEVAEVFG